MPDRRQHTRDELQSYFRDRRNWGRWGDKGAAGAMNMIDAEKRVAAAALVKSGRTVSLSRPWPAQPSLDNPRPAQQHLSKADLGGGAGWAFDYIGVSFHGAATTHIDALCHVWDEDGMWDGRDHTAAVTFGGANYGTVDEWSDGIVTRGVLLDVPKHRGKPYVTNEEPVHGWELEDIVREQGLAIQPGDAIMVYSGREAYAEEHDGAWWGGARGTVQTQPGLHASCLPFVRDNDISVLGWDMMDALPQDSGVPWNMHAVIFTYGVALLDNSLLQPLAEACAEEDRYEFMLCISPLKIVGGTGSPVNPIAVF